MFGIGCDRLADFAVFWSRANDSTISFDFKIVYRLVDEPEIYSISTVEHQICLLTVPNPTWLET